MALNARLEKWSRIRFSILRHGPAQPALETPTAARTTTLLWLSAILVVTPLLAGCGSTFEVKSLATPQVSATVVAVSPTTATLSAGAQEQLTVAVTGALNSQVTWEVNGEPGGSTVLGTVSSSGMYTAPAVPPPGGSVQVQAASVNDPQAVGSATISILDTISISPETATLATNATQQFTAYIDGSASANVQWSVNSTLGGNATVGTISTSGLYTSPSAQPVSAVTITAAETANPSLIASLSITVFDPAIVNQHNLWLAGVSAAAASYGCTGIGTQQKQTQTVDEAISQFEQTATEGSCLALWPISTDTSNLIYSISWGGNVNGVDIRYISDVSQMRIWAGMPVSESTQDASNNQLAPAAHSAIASIGGR
jgi:hypothetical protein